MKDFSTNSQALLDQYKFSLLCELDNSQQIEEQIRQAFTAFADTSILEVQKFADSQKHILHQAFEYGKQGTDKESGEFQDFISTVKKLNDVTFTKAVLSCYDKGFSQCEQGFSPDAIAEAIRGNSFAQSQSSDEIARLMDEIRQKRSWQTDANTQRKLKENVERIKELDPEKGDEAQQVLARGPKIADLQNRAYHAGYQNNTDTRASLLEEAKGYGYFTNDEIKSLAIQFTKGKRRKKNHDADSPIAKIDVPQYDLSTKHPFFIGNLQAENCWRIFVDETGCIFDERAFSEETCEKERGKMVALFIPPHTDLPQLGKHHATNAGTAKNQEVLTDLFTKGKNCGILGVTLDAMAQVKNQDYWRAAFERLFDITLRLLPVSDKSVKLEFFIENRGDANEVEKTAAELRQISDIALLHLAKSFPEKANQFSFKINCIAKNQTADPIFMAFNGYVDTVACAWSRGREELYSMLKKGGFLHRCLLDGSIQEFPAIMDKLEKNELPSVEQWNRLISSKDRNTVDSLVNMLLFRLGYILQQNTPAWKSYVEAVLSHLDSKAIRLSLLSKQINWLNANMPAEEKLPPRLRIIWLTAKLAEENHKGIIAEHLADELEKMLPSMFLEDAPLCCWSVLHQAVTQTNAFRFETAREIIYKFCDAFGLIDRDLTYQKLFPDDKIAPEMQAKVAVPGLRYYGQLLSSLGQHEAFLGNPRQAHEYFRCAIKCFSLLSDNKMQDISQTESYWIINLMDHSKPLDMLSQMEKYLQDTLDEAVERMAGSSDPADKYRHHIMLRYFQLLPAGHPAIRKYLELSSSWKTAEGHPWEMIEFYRALMVEDENKRLKHLESALKTAEKGGPTLLLIASMICGSIYYYDRSQKERFENLTEQTIAELPDLGEKRIAVLRNQLTSPLPPLEFAKQVLPFNFR